MEWISVADRMPISEREMDNAVFKSVDVIVVTEGGNVSATECNAGKVPEFWCQFNFRDEFVTHWMPLPAPPQSEEP